MTNPIRRYFLANDSEAQLLINSVIAQQDAHSKRLINFLAQFNTQYFLANSGLPTQILLKQGSETPEGLRIDGRLTHEGHEYMKFKPLLNTKAGRSIKAKMIEVGKFNHSDIILAHYQCSASIFTGGRIWVATAFIPCQKNLIAIQVPQNDERQYEPHPTFREIKKSEYVAITEE